MEIIIADLESELAYIDQHISHAWEDVERIQEYLVDHQQRVNDAFNKYNKTLSISFFPFLIFSNLYRFSSLWSFRRAFNPRK